MNHIADANKMVSDTPRTDEAQFGTGRVSVDFARRLERELNAANDRIKRLEECVTAKWFWMMDYCKKKSVSPALGWKEAETEWNKLVNEAKP